MTTLVKKPTIMMISGSIRKGSSSHVVLDEVTSFFNEAIEFDSYNDLAAIPAFDGREADPAPVEDFKNRIKKAGGILICTPEYAFGVPGALKNALDWTVSTGDFMDKPVALITASTGGEKGHDSLQLTLTALSSRLLPDATLLISFIRAKVKEGKLVNDETRSLVHGVIKTLMAQLEMKV